MDYKTEFGLPKAIKGKTFAEAAKYIEKLFEGRNSKIDNDTKGILMQRLRNLQESKKEKKQQQVPANQFQLGGEPTYPGQGVIQANPNINQQVPVNASLGLPNTNISDINANAFTWPIDQTPKVSNTSNGSTSWWDRNKSLVGDVASYGLMASPIIGNMMAMKNLSKPETVSAGNIKTSLTPQLVNRQQIERNLVRQLAGNRQALQSVSSGDFGQYAANLQSLHSSSASALGTVNLQADMADAQERARVEEGNIGIQQFNINQQQRSSEINAQNQAAYDAQKLALQQGMYQNISNVGQSLFNYKQAQKYADAQSRAMMFLALNKTNPQQEIQK